MEAKQLATWDDFMKVDMRVGTIIHAELFEGLNKPAYKIHIDFGNEIGIKKTSAQVTKLYQPEDLLNKQVIGVVNFPPKQIKNFFSECLLMGAVGENGEITLLQTEREIKNGLRIG